jgi:predicted lipid-binding transport protein (Tim44 family)
MRAAAVALVLIIGAVVLLIFANTLNSWVLGGLIGGLAALLISIPISLFLFTILARRHDEELRALQEVLEEEMAAAGIEGREYAEVYEANAYVLSNEENFYNDARGRRLSGARSLPAAGQSQASVSAYGTYNQRPGNYPPG